MSDALNISAQITPNPNTLKFVLNKIIIPNGSIDFSTEDRAKNSPIAENLFKIDGVVGVMVGVNFVSVSKSYTVDWASLAEPVTDTIKSTFENNTVLVNPDLLQKMQESAGADTIEARIREILDQEIRPAVAMDGGDIVFEGYEDGIVSLHLQGACSSCPSSTLTLKMGIENRLKEEFPEIVEVIQV